MLPSLNLNNVPENTSISTVFINPFFGHAAARQCIAALICPSVIPYILVASRDPITERLRFLLVNLVAIDKGAGKADDHIP